MRKLILIPDDLYVRSFVRTGALREIEDEETFYVASDRLAHLDEVRALPNFAGTLTDSPERDAQLRNYRLLSMKDRSDRSFAMRYRIKTMARRDRLRLARLELAGGNARARAGLLRRLGPNPELQRLLAELKPDLLIAPTATTDALVHDALLTCPGMGVETMLLVNGWDNMSCKGALPAQPTSIAVWGEQSVELAERIHDIPRERAFPIGAPTFDGHFRYDPAANPSPYPFPYVLFAGNANPFDELTALHHLEDAVERSGRDELRIVYRPHPWRHRRLSPDDFRPEDFRRTVLDEQVADAYRDSKTKGSREPAHVLPDLDYYPGLLGHAELTVCPLSTMVLESAIVGTPVLAPAYDDGVHPATLSEISRFEYLEGIGDVPGITVCTEAAALGNLLLAELAKRPPANMREGIRWYLNFDDRPYGQRLRDLVATTSATPTATVAS